MPRFSEEHKTLEQALNKLYVVDQLASLARQINWILNEKGVAPNKTKGLPTRKADLIQYICQSAFKHLKVITAQLDDLGASAIAETVYNWNGKYEPEPFFAKYNAYPSTETDSSDQRSYRNRNNLHLLYLFFIRGIIPDDLLEALKKVIKPPKEDKINYSRLVPASLTVRETAHAAAINLNAMLTLVEENKIRVSKATGRATAATLKTIDTALYNGDFYEDETYEPIQSFAWPLLLQGGGLAEIDGSLLKLTNKGKTAFKKDLAQGLKAICTKWEKTKLIDEYSRISIVKGQKAVKGRVMTTPVRRRPIINGVLSSLKVGRWITIDELTRFMRSENLTFDMTNFNWKLYVGDSHYGHIDHFDTWPVLQLRYLLVYFFEYCATLGIIDVAYKEPDNARKDYNSYWNIDQSYLSIYDGLMQIRLNDLGAFVLGLTKKYTPEGSQAFEVCDTDIVFTGKGEPLPDFALYLDKIGERTEAHKWHLSMTSLITAIKAGESLKSIRGFITKIVDDQSDVKASKKSNKPLLNLFEEVNNLSSAVVDKGDATLLECQAHIRKQLLMDKKISKLCMPAGDRHIVILPGKKEQFVGHLEALGIIIS